MSVSGRGAGRAPQRSGWGRRAGPSREQSALVADRQRSAFLLFAAFSSPIREGEGLASASSPLSSHPTDGCSYGRRFGFIIDLHLCVCGGHDSVYYIT